MPEALPLITLYLSDRCNSRCITCDYWKNGLRDMDLEDDHALLYVGIEYADGKSDPYPVRVPVEVTDTGKGRTITHLPGDVNGDGVVNALDLDEVVDHFGTTATGQ